MFNWFKLVEQALLVYAGGGGEIQFIRTKPKQALLCGAARESLPTHCLYTLGRKAKIGSRVARTGQDMDMVYYLYVAGLVSINNFVVSSRYPLSMITYHQ